MFSDLRFALTMFILLPILVVIIIKKLYEYIRNNKAPVITVDAYVEHKRVASSRYKHFYYAEFLPKDGGTMKLRIPSDDYEYFAITDHGKLTYQGTRFISFVRDK